MPQVNADLRERVALCVAGGMTVAAIADALGVPEERLRAEFGRELEHGHAIVRADQLAALAAAAKGGNTAAAKTLIALASKPDPEQPRAHQQGGDIAARALRILEGGKK